RIGQVAVAEGPAILATRRLEEGRRHARDLAPAVAGLLEEHSWNPADVDAVVVSRGPGSYTGLRVGIMSAKAFAYATGCALLAVDTFAAVALQTPAEATSVDVIADAQQEKVYVQSFARATGAHWRPVSALAIVQLVPWLADRDAAAWLSGPGVQRYEDKLSPGHNLVSAAHR